jgi:NADPH-dependent 2,4-dienoyl-CoA reductase/sulfur reductase-like enzyme
MDVAEVKYLVIGGGLAAFHGAKQIRRNDADGSLLVVSEEPFLPYDKPPLSKEFLRGEKSLEEITYESAEKIAETNIEYRLNARVESLNAGAKTAVLEGGETINFEKCLLATGARPIVLPLPGASLSGVHYLRSAEDALAIAQDAGPDRTAVIIGGGFIGVETAASLTKLDVKATVIETMPHIWARMVDAPLAHFVQDYCAARGVTFLLNETVSELRGEGRVDTVVTRSGMELPCDLVIIGVGIRPNVELAEAAGLTVDNGIVVDEYMRTSDPDIYAAGDVVNYPDPVAGRRRRVEHWGHAEYSGQIAGRNMAGANIAYDFLSYVWSDVFDLHLEFAGDEHEHDEKIIRGNPEDGSFTELYMKEGAMTAYFAINTDFREFSVFRRLIRGKKDLRGREADLQNREFNLRELV